MHWEIEILLQRYFSTRIHIFSLIYYLFTAIEFSPNFNGLITINLTLELVSPSWLKSCPRGTKDLHVFVYLVQQFILMKLIKILCVKHHYITHDFLPHIIHFFCFPSKILLIIQDNILFNVCNSI
jgi:hypothetical protein